MGNKWKSDSDRTNKRVSVMLTQAQHEKLQELAKADHDRPLSNFLRKYLRDHLLKEDPK